MKKLISDTEEDKGLKNCPFCGASAVFIRFEYGDHYPGENDYVVRCTGKDQHQLDYIESKQNVMEVWNQRVGE